MKKNVLKKFAAAALAAATVMSSMSVMAFAADAATGTEEKGSVTITKYMGDTQNYETLGTHYGAEQTSVSGEKLQNVKFAYIEVGDRVQVDVQNSEKTTTEMLYTLSDEAVTALGLQESDKVVENNKTYYRMSTLDAAIRGHKNQAIDLVKKAIGNHEAPTTNNGTVKFSDLSLEKLYLFAEIDASAAKKLDGTAVAVTKVSVPFFVSLPFTDANGNSVTDIYAYPKNSTGNVDIDKEIDLVGTTAINGKQANANIGDEITYKVTYSVPVPENGLTELKIVDTMDKGLTFTNNASNITVKDDKVEATSTGKELAYGTEYEVSLDETNNKVIINFDKYLNSLQKNSTEEFTITYKVKLNESAVLGQAGNKNKVELKYKNYDETDSKTKTPDKEVKIFTYGIDLTKQGEGGAKLSGVEFKLTDGNNEINVKQSGNAYYPSKDADASSTVTTDNDGKIYIRGLKPGTYKLTETKTNNGYVLLKNPVVIVITEDSNTPGVATATVGDKAVTMNADQNNKDSNTAEVPLTVVNSKGFDLPATGGRGIALFTIAGIAIVAAAGSLLFMRKRSK